MGGQPLGHGAVAAPPHRDAIRRLARPSQKRARALNLRPEQRDARLRLEFGSNVLISADGAVTLQAGESCDWQCDLGPCVTL